MAVFGVPTAREDDALRACRAAAEILGAGLQVDARIAQERDEQELRLDVRIGIETGEVMVGGDPGRPNTFTSGVAVNTAARLQQAGGPGQCLLGPGCYRLVGDAVEVEARDGLVLQGFATPVTAYRLLAVPDRAGGPVRDRPGRPMARLVGRSREMVLLRQAYERAATDRTCQLVTVLGPAGAGKSRLAAEFLAGLQAPGEDARPVVLRGRCLSYGEGVTYWPLVEVVRQAAGLSGAETDADARARLTALLATDPDTVQVVGFVAPVAGLGGAPGTLEDTAWAVQRLLETLAADRPVVLVVDDLHWAEPGLRAIIDGVSEWSRDAPILILVLARPELLDDVPDWGAGKRNAVAAHLEPLGDAELDALTSELLHGDQLPAGVAARIRVAAGGNPLFVEQLLAMLTEIQELGQDDITDLQVPPTIVALLTARLDRLSRTERAVLGAASVIGQTFYRAAVTELSEQPATEVADALKTLLRKGLVRPERTDLPGQDASRFDHVLVRDAAYHALTKQSRARLHERFARWLDNHTAGQAYDDFVGSHLEAAYRNRAELGTPDGATRRLGEEAAARLAAAGQLLLGADDPAAIALLTRALALHPDQCPARWSIQFDLIDGLDRSGLLRDAAELADSIHAAAQTAGDQHWSTRGRLAAAYVRQLTAPEGATELLAQEAEHALVEFDRFGDELGLGWAHQCMAQVASMSGRVDMMAKEKLLAAEHLTRAGRTQRAQVNTSLALGATMIGRHPAWPGLVEARRQVAMTDGRMARMVAWTAVSFFAALQGRTEEERQAGERAEQLHAELQTYPGAVTNPLGVAALACGRPYEAVNLFARGCAALELAGDTSGLSTSAAYHAHALLLTEEPGPARQQVDRALETGATDDVLTQGLARSALAWLAAVDGDHPATVRRHMTDALAALEPTDLLLDRALVHAACAEAARLLGDETAARHHRQAAIELYDAKENVVGAAVQRALL
jgi:AAA ATPase domain/Adenylate and Guanylate cyclase catalytic domain